MSATAIPLVVQNYPLLDAFWTMLLFFVWILWIFLLVRILTDVFRSSDLSGWAKAGWTVFVIILPLIAVLIYLIVRGGSMHEREQRRAEDSMRGYMQSVGVTSAGTAEELSKLADLRDRGVLTPTEFEAQKAKLIA